MDDADRWLADNDPAHTPDSWHRWEIPVGLTAELEQETFRGGRLVEHQAVAAEKLCVGCSKSFAPRKSDHNYCGELCRGNARRTYQRDLMRQRRAA